MKKITRSAIEAFQGGLDALCSDKWFPLYGNGLCILALAVAKYGAGFTWRQVLVGWLAFAIWNAGSDLLQLGKQKPKFERIQFRVGLTHLAQAFIDAGIYSEADAQNSTAIYESLGRYSSGYITFTWLEQGLFFMNEASSFSEFAEVTIGLKPFGKRAAEIWDRNGFLPDGIELRRRRVDAYELVLIKSENRPGWWAGRLPDDEGPTLTLIKIPYEFLRNLQEPIERYKGLTDYFKQQREILERAELEYWQHPEVSSAWDYRGKYADLHWWNISEMD